jgi:hypothetical protein
MWFENVADVQEILCGKRVSAHEMPRGIVSVLDYLSQPRIFLHQPTSLNRCGDGG